MDRKRNVVIAIDENARKIFDEAFATLDRTADITVERRDHSGEYWSRPEPKPAPEPVPQARTLTDSESLRWQTYIDNRISAAFEARAWRDDARRDAMAEFVAQVRKQLRGEIQEQIGLLRADVEIQQKAAERRERGDGVVELPPFIQRRRHDAA
jgi:hypothetical protein